MSSFLEKVIKLRGHHLICLHFFSGEGYDAEFVSNLREVLERAKSGEEIEVCTGADDICKMCPYLKGDRCLQSRDAEAEIREMDRKAVELLKLENFKKVKWLDIKGRLPEIIYEWSGRFCRKCDWRRICEAMGMMTSVYRRE